MAGLYERLMGWTDADVKLPVHQFQAALGEVARGVITQAQGRALVDAMSPVPLTQAEALEAQALLNTITGSVSAKLARAKEIDDVLLLAERRASGYDTPTLVRARLGV